MDLCLELNEYSWFELVTISEVIQLGKAQDHCLAELCHYHEDFIEGQIHIFACYRDKIFNKPIMYAITMADALMEMGTDNAFIPPQKYVDAALAFIHSEYVGAVWDVDGNIHEAGIIKVNGEWISVRNLPDDVVVGHTLNLNNINTCHELPKGMTVCGDLKIVEHRLMSCLKVWLCTVRLIRGIKRNLSSLLVLTQERHQPFVLELTEPFYGYHYTQTLS